MLIEFEIIAKIGDEIIRPYGFFYKKNKIILVGNKDEGHYTRRSEYKSEVVVTIMATKTRIMTNVIV